jgi:hypothetical protein
MGPYFLVAIPLFFSVGIISVLVRPHYLIMIAKLYDEVILPEGSSINNVQQNIAAHETN